jgi:ubiquitin-protein ligase E3 C
MTFEIDDDSGGLGVVKTVDLLRGSGAQRKVLTRGDVNHYVVLVTRYWMFDRIQHHIEHIRLGINDVVPLDFFNMFNSTELQTLLSGSEAAIDVADWRENSSYHGFSGPDDPVLIMFWRVVEEFSADERSRLLHYVTSCSRPPLLGFAALNPGFPPVNIFPPCTIRSYSSRFARIPNPAIAIPPRSCC